MDFVTGVIRNRLEGVVASGITAAGEIAGDSVSGFGNVIENGGRSVGDGVARTFDGWGGSIRNYGSRATSSTPARQTSSKVIAVKKQANNRTATTSSQEKLLPSSASKALPATKPLKTLPPPESVKAPAAAPRKPPANKNTAPSNIKKPVVGNRVRKGQAPENAGNGPKAQAAPNSAAQPRPNSQPKGVNQLNAPSKKITISPASRPKPKGPVKPLASKQSHVHIGGVSAKSAEKKRQDAPESKPQGKPNEQRLKSIDRTFF
ncbi:hypothetical protein P152DRAFT_480769 [Eremomyces bilateralis CBS 781.70]|uniref:Uncharacterized protein n=1 Tax=Eremomyces bilateralis CBS 781.70 TaxID=1392243 RepID=A0A6G1G937_9PEZI|nr:uncharacterized protein P152DRAFT_480769 [Eremomyces bilateralis CBS 781.70]KAF1814615.1 hypothetical protein P152DRAFT_480769 [Eremomyces bilateralis CBS 781.70]